MSDPSQLFREAWKTSTGHAAADRLLRRSLSASARRFPEVGEMARSLELAGRAQLDLHLVGEREDRHETSASALGDFLQRVSRAVREVAKSAAGVRRLTGDISVLAPSAGSVRVVFVEQAGRRNGGTVGTRADWSVGMERVASTFVAASDESETLEASVQDLSVPAREAMRGLAAAVADHKWGIVGSITTREGEKRALRLTTAAAGRLVAAVHADPSRTSCVRAEGYVDGWRWSSSTMRLVPDRGAAIEAHVPHELQRAVAHFHVDPARRVVASFDLHERLSSRAPGKVVQSYALTGIEAVRSLFDE